MDDSTMRKQMNSKYIYNEKAEKNNSFAQRLLLLRTERGLTQKDAAEKLGLRRQTLDNYERGIHAPSFEALRKIIEFYGVSADYMTGLCSERTTDMDLRAACEYTMLSEAAMETLLCCGPILNDLLECMSTFSLVESLSALNFCLEGAKGFCDDFRNVEEEEKSSHYAVLAAEHEPDFKPDKSLNDKGIRTDPDEVSRAALWYHTTKLLREISACGYDAAVDFQEVLENVFHMEEVKKKIKSIQDMLLPRDSD